MLNNQIFFRLGLILQGIVIFFVSGTLALAQGDVAELGVIVVSATRVEAEGRALGSYVTVIDEETIKQSGHTQVGEILRYQTGLDVSRAGGLGATTDIRMRGANNQYTQVLVDGMMINDPGTPQNTASLEQLSLANVKRIEVIRGSQSVVHGSDAIAGTINIITKEGEGELRTTAKLTGGSWNSWEVSGLVNGALTDNTRISLSLSQEESDGFSSAVDGEDDAYENTTLTGRLNHNLSEELSLEALFRYSEQEGEFDVFSGGQAVDADNIAINELLTSRVNFAYVPLGSNWKHQISAELMRSERESFEPRGSDPDVFEGSRERFIGESSYEFGYKNVVTLGLQSEKSAAETKRPAWWANDIDEKFRTNSYFVELQYAIADNLFTTIGGRLDDHDEFGSESTYRGSLAYFLNPELVGLNQNWELKLRGSIGTGFKTPTLTQLFDPDDGNPDLDPETSQSWEVGFELDNLDRSISLQSTFFTRRIEDQIPSFAPFENSDDSTRARGIESSLAFLLGSDWQARVGYTNVLSTDELRIPRSETTLGLSYHGVEDLVVAVDWYRRGQMDEITPDPLESYETINLSAQYQAGSHRFFGRIDNLADVDYEELAGYNSPPRFMMIGMETEF